MLERWFDVLDKAGKFDQALMMSVMMTVGLSAFFGIIVLIVAILMLAPVWIAIPSALFLGLFSAALIAVHLPPMRMGPPMPPDPYERGKKP